MLIKEYVDLELQTIIDRFPKPKLLGTLKNNKIGVAYSFSGLSAKKESCPGMSKLCSSMCYDAFGQHVMLSSLGKSLRTRTWYTYLSITDIPLLEEQIKNELYLMGTPQVRIHVGGDFGNIELVKMWIRIVKEFAKGRSVTKFWGYTRSWRVPELYDSLVELRDLPNMQLFASVDVETGLPPDLRTKDNKSGWRIASMGIEYIPGLRTVRCLYEVSKNNKRLVPNCQKCGLCYNDVNVNIDFELHGSQGIKNKKVMQELIKNSEWIARGI